MSPCQLSHVQEQEPSLTPLRPGWTALCPGWTALSPRKDCTEPVPLPLFMLPTWGPTFCSDY